MKNNLLVKPNTAGHNKTGPWRTYRPVTDYAICISCTTCAKLCPEACIEMAKLANFEKLKPVTDYDYCKGCGLCAKECPVKAIKMAKDF